MSTAAMPIYPLLTLKKTVILPGTEARLTIGRRRSLAAVDSALAMAGTLVVSTQFNGEDDEPCPEGLNRIGTLVRILDTGKQGGTRHVAAIGIARVELLRVELSASGYTAEVCVLEEPSTYSAMERTLESHVVELYVEREEGKGRSGTEAREELARCAGPSEVADYLGSQLFTDWQERQAFLATLHPADRLERLAISIGGEAAISDLDSRIRNRVRQQIDKSQREYYLREQLKVIHDELSGEGGSEVEALREKVEATNLPEEVAERALREISRLERVPSTSPEGGVIRTYIDWILALPWSTRSADNYDLRHAEEVLDNDHYGMEKVKDRILEFLAVRELTTRSGEEPKGAILCLVGPPGVGKTSLGQSIARSLGRSFVRISLGGVRDEAEIRGHRRTYVGALPGRLIHGLRQAGTSNPVMLLDELDKMSSDFRGDPAAAMLEVLDPEQNRAFVDHYMELPYDLSKVLFIATANTLDTVPRPLLDRMEVVHLGGYTEDEKVRIARGHLLPRQLRLHGLTPSSLELSERMLRNIVRYHTREAGVRNLERQIGAVCRKSARRLVSGHSGRVRVTSHMLEEYLGRPRHVQDVRSSSDQIGVAMGMAWTELGGSLLPVEVATLPGKGTVTVTGRLGEVMQESARAALSYTRSRAQDLRIAENFQETTDWHIHLPEGAIPKDGPSAGITMALGMISALTGRPIRADVAMTGEITLRGRVLPIGGFKEKVLAAHQAGIKQIVAPHDNAHDFEEIPRNVRRELQFHWVRNMDEVLAIALTPDQNKAVDLRLLSQPATLEVPMHGRTR